MNKPQTSGRDKPAAEAKPAATRTKAAFSAASFAVLRSVTGEAQGDAIRIALADIDEDASQPRTAFDADELASLAESIKRYGIVQPIVVRPAVVGRYMLAFGARRLRAARLAGLAQIPAVIRARSEDDFAAQLIENQQRAALSNSDLAAAISRLYLAGKTVKQIGTICALKEHQLLAFRQVERFPPELRARLDTSDMRALYELYRQWTKTPEPVLAAFAQIEGFVSVAEARRIIAAITRRPAGGAAVDLAEPAPAQAAPIDEGGPGSSAGEASPSKQPAAGAEAPCSAQEPGDTYVSLQRASPAAEAEVPQCASPANGPKTPQHASPPRGVPAFIVALADGTQGRLVVDRRAERDGWALVEFATGAEEVELAALRLVRID